MEIYNYLYVTHARVQIRAVHARGSVYKQSIKYRVIIEDKGASAPTLRNMDRLFLKYLAKIGLQKIILVDRDI